MSQYLRASFFIYIATLIAQAALAPFYETGIWRVVTPALCLSFVAIALSFIRRKQRAWPYMLWVSFFGILINAFFFPTSEYYGRYTVIAQALSAVEIGTCAVVLWSILRHQATKRWFTAAQ
ncbi:hypothetical protein [Marilutibacter alkalisoli]|uniref:Uncharacterized protein n=1 Tax=Marilutibacter alkalisoli TaxID=2591633 RepID=A0A514BQQ9_9GAMM|nr:hypothetical protein [Lysobacter alkalisoli]QDH69696.1 hypothetical protein FKV23_05995 [Lysobacter alkalisoli]